MGRLDELEMDQRLANKQYLSRLEVGQRRLLQLRLHLGGQMGTGELGPGLLVVMEGPDAGGKGGSIKRVVQPLDPRHYRVSTYAKPTYDEKRHHFLRRFYRELPGLGGMAVFDRSWYGRVLVERIEGFATTEQWGRAYEEIVSFERTDHRLAPWDLIPANQKKFARVQVLETVIDRIEAGMRRWGTPVPSATELTGFDEE